MSGARVFFVNRFFHPDESATGQLLSDLAFGLAAANLGGPGPAVAELDVRIVCCRHRYEAAGEPLAAHERVRGVSIHRVWTTRFGRGTLVGRALDYLTFYVSCFVMLLRLTGRGDILVAKTDPPLIGLVVAIVARIKGGALVNWLQDVFPEVATRLRAIALPGWVDRALCACRDASWRAARMNVVIGLRMRDYLLARGIPAARIRVVENWALTDAAAPARPEASALRAQLGLGSHFVVGYSGNLGRAHEYAIFGQAALALTPMPVIQFLFIGGGASMRALQELAAGAPNMRFLGYRPREALADSLAAADVHLVSLRPELEGLVVPSKFYGILAAGRPVVFVGDPQGELARVIQGSGCGLVVPSGNAAALAEAILDLYRSVERRDAMGSKARQVLSGRFELPRAVSCWRALIAELSANGATAAPAGVHG